MAQLFGHQFQQDSDIEKQISTLISSVEKHSAKIEGPRDPQSEFAASNKALADKSGEVRGRGLFFPYIGSGLGRGPYAELEDGSIKIDLINGIGINIFGHSHPRLMAAAVRGAIQDVVIQGNLQIGKEWLELSKKLVEIASRNSPLKYAWITTSGSMSGENALKMCRQKTNAAKKIISMKHAFAGRSQMMAEITDNDTMRVGLPRYDEVERIPFYDKNDPQSTEKSLRALKEIVAKHKGDICTFVFEPMQGEGGYNVAPKEFFEPLLAFTKEQGIPNWFDEVQTFCRTGEFFAYETLDLGKYVDICTVAKTLQAGATLYTEELNPQPGLIAGTFAGSSAALSAGLEVLNMLDNDGYLGKDGKIWTLHHQFVDGLKMLNETSCKGLLQDAGGLGLMCAVTPLDGSKEKMMELIQVLYKNGLVTFGCGRGPFRLRFLLPAVMTEADVKVALSIIEKSVLELA